MSRQGFIPVTTPGNAHAGLPNREIHPPRGYDTAANDTHLDKDIHGYVNWQRILSQQPVTAFISLASTVTPSDGLRYIVTGTTSMASSSVFGGAAPNDIIEYITLDPDGNSLNQWNNAPPVAGMSVYVESEDTWYYWDGSVWKQLGISTGGTYETTLTGDNSTYEFTVTHNLNTTIPFITARRDFGDYAFVNIGVIYIDANTVKFQFSEKKIPQVGENFKIGIKA